MVRDAFLLEPLPQLDPNLPMGSALVAVARACCQVAMRALARDGGAGGVHRVRQALKRARAVLRLMEDAGVTRARALRREIARLARMFSVLRDTAVTARTAMKIAEKLDDRQRTVARTLATRESARPSDAWRSARRGELARIERRLASLRRGDFALDGLEAGLRHSARRVRKQAKRVRTSPAIEAVHEWRKRVIVLREQVRVTRPLLGPAADELHARLKRLARRLGAATDYRVLLEAVARARGAGRRDGGAPKFAAVVRKKQKRAIKLARKCWRKMKRTAAFRRLGHDALVSA